LSASRHRVEAVEGDTVEIVWTLASGLAYVQQLTVPPPATREARRNEAGQILDRDHQNAAGQKFNMHTSLDVVGTVGGKATTEVIVPHAPFNREPVRPPEDGTADRPRE
jgi:hypothetical protein